MQLGDDWLWGILWGPQTVPDRKVEVRDAGFLASRDFGGDGHALSRRYGVGANLAVVDEWRSFGLDVCRLDDWRPSGDVALHQQRQSLRASHVLVRNLAAKLNQALARILVIERLVEGSENGLRGSLRREQGPPRRRRHV